MSEWTKERIEEASRLWLSGVSALQIAERLGGLTRNAVIGKINRLGLMRASRDGSGKLAAVPVERTVVAAPAVAETVPEPVPVPSKPVRILPSILVPSAPEKPKASPRRADAQPRAGNPVTPLREQKPPRPAPKAALPRKPATEEERTVRIMDLRDYMCKWPLGDPGAESFRYCGHRNKGGTPYCEAHGRLAYMPTAPRLRGSTRSAASARK